MSQAINEVMTEENKMCVWYTQLKFGLRSETIYIVNKIWGKGNNILDFCELYQCHIDIPDTICQ